MLDQESQENSIALSFKQFTVKSVSRNAFIGTAQ